ncbi:TetR/AcrR family transcriptional regulator [Sphingomonas adhaesiva]|uniref:TetR/AcrR family transcriptional regulator n=1 Tax=Sphingomonas adhaesiva TaxID=28212 RepID=UPI002FF46A84
MTTAPPPSPEADDPARVLSRQAVYDLVWSQPMSSAAAELGLTGNGLAKVCDRLLIPYPTRGYWAKVYAGRDEPQTPLPPAPPGTATEVSFAPARARSRRPRHRLSRSEREEQILSVAERIMRAEGVHAMTLKRVARDVGISEAQVYNYYRCGAEVMVAIARTELTEMNKARLAASRHCTDPRLRYTLTSIAYLRQVAKRGDLLPQLLAVPEVRLALRDEHEERRHANRTTLGEVFDTAYGVPPPVSTLVAAMLTAMSLRGGRLLARGKIDLDTAERLVVPLIGAGNDYMIGRHGGRAASEQVGA